MLTQLTCLFPCVSDVLATHSDFFPVILSFLRQLPVIGNILSLPGVANVSSTYAFNLHNLRSRNHRLIILLCHNVALVCSQNRSWTRSQALANPPSRFRMLKRQRRSSYTRRNITKDHRWCEKTWHRCTVEAYAKRDKQKETRIHCQALLFRDAEMLRWARTVPS